MPEGSFTGQGTTLVPGYNVDRVDVAAGMAQAQMFGYDDVESQMVVEYALMRWRRGEEDGADRTALSGGIDLTSWRAVIAAARAAAEVAAAARPTNPELWVPNRYPHLTKES